MNANTAETLAAAVNLRAHCLSILGTAEELYEGAVQRYRLARGKAAKANASACCEEYLAQVHSARAAFEAANAAYEVATEAHQTAREASRQMALPL